MPVELIVSELLDLNQTIGADVFTNRFYLWDILPELSDFIMTLGSSLPNDKYEILKDGVWAARTAFIDSHCRIEPPTIIDEGAQIRFGAFIRGSVIVGKNSVVGNSTELKNCILFNKVQVPHFNYVGDSVLGFSSHLGAGAIISNVRSDKKSIVVTDGTKKIETNMKKFGAILGDFVEVGCNAVINPGTIIGRNSIIYPLSMVRGKIDKWKIHKNNGQIVPKIP
ncbi:MAG: UDP-N-acetylglucosamine pyrophosphorylase [Oscillospiraceae bacterium]|nr:UDP-N-acetylglucosamine pyrophosphorylase [Oscillospiraceae bacterium]